MSFHLLYALLVILLNVLLANSSPFFQDYEDPAIAKKFSQFNCFKKRSCTPGPPKVCGYDLKTRELAEFEDKCTYHRINCKGGFFKLVDMLACESKKSFAAMENATLFQWQHVNNTVLREARAQEDTITEKPMVESKAMTGLYEDPVTAKKFGQFNCFKEKSCTPGPPKVCGYDVKTRELAEFEDKCTYHRINCEGGFFKLVDMLACESKKAFAAMENATLLQRQHVNRAGLRKGRVQEDITIEKPMAWSEVMTGLVKTVLKNVL